MGVLTALLARERTGKGQLIRSGLFETAAFWVGQHVALAAMTRKTPPPMPVLVQSGGWGVYQLFDTADELKIFIGITSNAHWDRFCREFELMDLLEDASLNTNQKRIEGRPRVIPRIQEIASRHKQKELGGILDRIQVPFAYLNTPADLLEDEHMNAGHLMEVEAIQRKGKKVKVPALPMMSDQYNYSVRLEPPHLGQHTDDILKDLSYATERIDRLKREGVVKAAEQTQ
jgi:crotonobetainyl-CoA:carnitine CoA-transferase CaiB-like acyl-CoA transferase